MIEIKPDKVSALGEQVFIEVLETEQVTKSGLLLPDSTKEEKGMGIVVDVGEDVKKIKAKNAVIYSKYTTQEFKIDDKMYAFVKEEDVLGVLK